MSLESSLHKYVRKACKQSGVLCYKFSSPAKRGVPDLILIGVTGRVMFIELKSPSRTGRLSKLQLAEIKKLEDQGAEVYVIDNKKDADVIIACLSALS